MVYPLGLDFVLKLPNFIIIIKGLNKRSRLPRRQTLAVGSFPLARDQLTLGTRG